MYKVVVTDIDGVVDLDTLVILQRLQAEGIRCTVATGRGFLRARSALGTFCPNTQLILEGGGRRTSPDGENHALHPLTTAEIQEVEELLVSTPVLSAALIPLRGQRYYVFAAEEKQRRKEENFPFTERITMSPAEFCAWAHQLGCVKITLEGRNGLFTLPSRLNCARSAPDMYDITARGVHKGMALVELTSILRVSLKDVVVVGNDHNDIPMFQIDAAAKIAVGNCPRELLDLATLHIEKREDLSSALHSLFSHII